MFRFQPVISFTFVRFIGVLIALFSMNASRADANPNQATQTTYEHIEFPQPGVRHSDLQLRFKKNSPDHNLSLSRDNQINKQTNAAEKPYSALQTIGSLFFVLILFGCVAYWLRRGDKGSNPLLSEETWQVLGRGNLGTKHDVQLVRLGNRILLLGHSPNTIQTLVEITDPDEVHAMLKCCHARQPQSSIGFIRKLFASFAGKSDHTFDRINPGTHPAYVEPRDA